MRRREIPVGWWSFVLASALIGFVIAAPAETGTLSNRILVVGQGPEQPVIQDLARAFEKANPGNVVDLEWDRTLDTVDMVKTGQADLAVSGEEASGLRSTQVAWDGVAVIVNFSNPLMEVTTQQVQALFTGKFARWSQLDGADKQVDVIRRTNDQNLHTGFEQTLGIAGKMVASDLQARADQKALAKVSGRDNTITYISLKAALEAQEQGTPIRILTIDQVEPGDPTVKNGRYKLRRPVLFLTPTTRHPVSEAFTSFALSTTGQKILSKMYTPYDPPQTGPTQAKPMEPPPPSHSAS